jgi:predicted acylesterase/phospholipase RssA
MAEPIARRLCIGRWRARILHAASSAALAASAGTTDATTFYDTSHLKATLERLVDFDRLNAGNIRFSIGAVNVRSGNFVYFDTKTHTIGPEHIMASAALPPGFLPTPSAPCTIPKYSSGPPIMKVSLRSTSP